jgi:ferritin-like metal-binding protein YciE
MGPGNRTRLRKITVASFDTGIVLRKKFLRPSVTGYTEPQSTGRDTRLAPWSRESRKCKTMALFSKTELNSMDDLFLYQLQDLYDAEKQITEAIPKMKEAAANEELRGALESHLGETLGQIARLEQVFSSIGVEPDSETCEAMKGLLKEGNEAIDAKGDPDVKDAALIAPAQRVEHYEIASYGSARTFAERLGYSEAARLLQQTLDEEKNADRKLTAIAERGINIRATAAG